MRIYYILFYCVFLFILCNKEAIKVFEIRQAFVMSHLYQAQHSVKGAAYQWLLVSLSVLSSGLSCTGHTQTISPN